MTRLFLSLALATLASGCVGYYVPRPGTDSETLAANLAASQAAKESRVKAAEEAAAAKQAAWEQARTDYLASLKTNNPKRAAWFEKVLADPRVTVGMFEREVALLVHHSKTGQISKTVTSLAKDPAVSVWKGVELAGPGTQAGVGAHKAPLEVTFSAGKVTTVTSAQE